MHVIRPQGGDQSTDLLSMSTLSQDQTFIEAVKQGDVHAAATAAIRILKVGAMSTSNRRQGSGQRRESWATYTRRATREIKLGAREWVTWGAQGNSHAGQLAEN